MIDNDNHPAPRFNTLADWLRYQTRHFTTWLGQTGIRLKLHPDVITVIGLIVVLVAAWLTAQGQFFWAAIAMLLGTPLDALDGAIARAMNRKNRFGALLDSTLDRYADGFMFFGIGYYYAAHSQLNEFALSIVALIGAFAVSYVRARAEGLEIRSIKEGLFDRLVRTIVMFVMLLTGWIVPGLIILAIGNHLTAIQRIYLVYQATRGDETP
jgi:CDP-diacylglycerol---glycerol-3-phosphate 3-phosphatidyltransferase